MNASHASAEGTGICAFMKKGAVFPAAVPQGSLAADHGSWEPWPERLTVPEVSDVVPELEVAPEVCDEVPVLTMKL